MSTLRLGRRLAKYEKVNSPYLGGDGVRILRGKERRTAPPGSRGIHSAKQCGLRHDRSSAL